jgi:hypothetical protein
MRLMQAVVQGTFCTACIGGKGTSLGCFFNSFFLPPQLAKAVGTACASAEPGAGAQKPQAGLAGFYLFLPPRLAKDKNPKPAISRGNIASFCYTTTATAPR